MIDKGQKSCLCVYTTSSVTSIAVSFHEFERIVKKEKKHNPFKEKKMIFLTIKHCSPLIVNYKKKIFPQTKNNLSIYDLK